MPDELAAQLNSQVELDHNNDQIETPENLPVTGKRPANSSKRFDFFASSAYQLTLFKHARYIFTKLTKMKNRNFKLE